MNSEKPAKGQLFEKTTSLLIVAFVVGTAVVVPALLWAAKAMGWALPGPIESLIKMLGLG